jgi:MFS family permease
VLTLPRDDPPPLDAPMSGARRLWRERTLRSSTAGARRLWRERTLRGVTAGTTLAFAGAGALPVLVIARADELGSATAGAALMALMAGGALVGALLLAARADAGSRPERRVMAALVVVGLALAAGALGPGLGALGTGLALAGVADGVLLPAVLAVRAGHSPPQERGAVFTTAASLKVGAGAAGAGLGGLLVTAAGATTALLAAAALQLAGAAVCAAIARG